MEKNDGDYKVLCYTCSKPLQTNLSKNFKYYFCNKVCWEKYAKKNNRRKKIKDVKTIQSTLLEWAQEKRNEKKDFEAEMDEMWGTG